MELVTATNLHNMLPTWVLMPSATLSVTLKVQVSHLKGLTFDSLVVIFFFFIQLAWFVLP